MQAYYEKHLFIEPGIPYSFRTYTTYTDGPLAIVPPHYHLFLELLYCTDGCLEVLFEETTYALFPGDFILINAMTMHAIRSTSCTANGHIALLFDPNLLSSTSSTPFEMQYITPFTTPSLDATPFIFRGTHAPSPIRTLLEQIISEESLKHYGFELAIRNHIGSIFLWILRHPSFKHPDFSTTVQLTPQAMSRLQLVFDYIDTHYASDLSIETMASLCHVTYSYFSRFFKKHTQHNFKEYLNRVRIKKSENLLVSSSLSITEIGTAVGFTTTSYFIEQFKIYKHITPKKYRSLWATKQSALPLKTTHKPV